MTTKLTTFLTLFIASMYVLKPDEVKEIIVAVGCVIAGTGGAIAFDSRSKQITFRRIVGSFFMGLLVGMVANELVKIFNFQQWKVVSIMVGAFIAEYLLTWFSKRYMKIFDGASKKAGIDTKNEQNDL